MTYLEKAKEMLKDAHYVNWDRFLQIVCPMDIGKVEVEDRWAYMEDGSAVCPRCGKRYERRKFEFVGACCEACGANNIVKTEIKEDE